MQHLVPAGVVICYLHPSPATELTGPKQQQ